MQSPELIKALEGSKNAEYASFDYNKVNTTLSSEKKSKNNDYVSDMFDSHVVEPKYYH